MMMMLMAVAAVMMMVMMIVAAMMAVMTARFHLALLHTEMKRQRLQGRKEGEWGSGGREGERK